MWTSHATTRQLAINSSLSTPLATGANHQLRLSFYPTCLSSQEDQRDSHNDVFRPCPHLRTSHATTRRLAINSSISTPLATGTNHQLRLSFYPTCLSSQEDQRDSHNDVFRPCPHLRTSHATTRQLAINSSLSTPLATGANHQLRLSFYPTCLSSQEDQRDSHNDVFRPCPHLRTSHATTRQLAINSSLSTPLATGTNHQLRLSFYPTCLSSQEDQRDSHNDVFRPCPHLRTSHATTRQLAINSSLSTPLATGTNHQLRLSFYPTCLSSQEDQRDSHNDVFRPCPHLRTSHATTRRLAINSSISTPLATGTNHQLRLSFYPTCLSSQEDQRDSHNDVFRPCPHLRTLHATTRQLEINSSLSTPLATGTNHKLRLSFYPTCLSSQEDQRDSHNDVFRPCPHLWTSHATTRQLAINSSLSTPLATGANHQTEAQLLPYLTILTGGSERFPQS